MYTQLWLTYFTLNALALRRIPWDLGADLPAEEIRFIVPSIQEFQAGESSDGNRLRAAAAVWAVRHADADFPRVVDLFIAEEQRHAAELARYLVLNGHPVRARTAGDSAFRFLRHLTGRLEMSMSVLMTAEIIGFVYYEALRAGTRSPLLRSICDTFLLDEAAHLLFHMEQLSRMRRSRTQPIMWLARGLSWLLMAGACGVVWVRHRPVLQRGGLTLGGFVVSCFARLAFITRARHRGSQPRSCRPQPAGTPN
jgi:hypothetical protein